MSILSQFLIMHDTFSSHHANVFWREFQTCSDSNTWRMNHVRSNTSLHYLAMESLVDYPSKNAHCIYVVFWWQNFLLPMHDSSLAAMQMGLAGNSKKLHFTMESLVDIHAKKSHVTCLLCCFLVAVRAPIDSLLGLCVAPSFKS